MNDDALLIAQLEDKAAQAADRYMITSGNFLDSHQRRVAEDLFRSRSFPVRVFFYGGYDDAERCMPVFLPDYASEEDAKELLSVIRVTVPRQKGASGARVLTHRDYLGSLLALGIDREVTGDILVRRGDEVGRDGVSGSVSNGNSTSTGNGGANSPGPGADIIVQASMADFIQMNYAKAGHTWLSTEILPIDNLYVGAVNIIEQHDTVASLRLDSIAAAAFRLSRAKAAEAIRRGLVSVNSMETLRTDQLLQEGDKIVLRGKGRVILREVGGVSRKDRTRVTFGVYK